MSTRSELNGANPNRIADMFRQLQFGEALNFLLSAAGSESNTVGGAVTATVGADIGAFTDPPSAGQMATLRTFVNALKADSAAIIALLNQLRTAALSVSRTTETGVTVTSNVATLANAPSALFDINGTAGGSTGRKVFRVGPITGPNALVPAAGQAVWDGATKVLFSAVDAITTADFQYAKAADATIAALLRPVDAP